MIKNFHYFTKLSLILLSFLVASCNQPSSEITKRTNDVSHFKIEQPKEQLVSSQEIVVSFEDFDLSYLDNLRFLISSTFGVSLLKPTLINNTPQITIPSEFSRNAGQIQWELIEEGIVTEKGHFNLAPDSTNVKAVETYLGPPSISATARDYSMLVSIPNDSLDNMLPDGTQVFMSQQYKGVTQKETVLLRAGFTWLNIPAPFISGRINTGSMVGRVSSRQLMVDVFPDVAMDFVIFADTNHNYADGNELLTLRTNQLKDSNGNVMTDGTLVTFFITDENKQHWQATASTINGYAITKALHPEINSTWEISAGINGIGKSPKIDVIFKSVLEEFPAITLKKRTLIVGPLTSYLGQLVQDGIEVKLETANDSYKLRTKNGFISKELDSILFPKGIHEFTIKTLGLETKHSIILD